MRSQSKWSNNPKRCLGTNSTYLDRAYDLREEEVLDATGGGLIRAWGDHECKGCLHGCWTVGRNLSAPSALSPVRLRLSLAYNCCASQNAILCIAEVVRRNIDRTLGGNDAEKQR